MKKLYKSLLAACTLSLLMVVGSSPAYAGTIQHRFQIELPNGDKETLAGGPVIHSVFQDNSGGEDKLFVSDYCWYKGKGGDDTEHMSRLSDGYQCVTPSGCDYSTWHSPIFPAGFNKAGSFYVRVAVDRGGGPIYQSDVTETSFATFDSEGKTFTQRYPWAAQYFDANDPLGGGTFYWKGEAQSGSDSFRIIDGTKPGDTTKGFFDASKAPGGAQTYLSLMDTYWPTVLWRKFDGNNPAGNDKSLGSYDIKSVNNWSNGSVLYNSVGQNVLHGSVTWVLKNNIPSTPPEIPWDTLPTLTPITGTSPMCVSVELIDLSNKKVTDLSTIQVGDSLRAQCGEVAGNNMEYMMKVIEFNLAGDKVNETVQPQTSGRISLPYTIQNSGRYVVQCAICLNGACQEFESVPSASFKK